MRDARDDAGARQVMRMPNALARPGGTARLAPFAGKTRYLVVAGLLAILLVAALWVRSRGDETIAATSLWQPVAESGRPLTVVVGDYYMFARLDRAPTHGALGPELVWDRTVPTREDLTILQMLEPDRADRLVDYNQHFVSSGTIDAVSRIRGELARLPGAARRPVRLVPSSELTPEILASTDIVYVGPLGGLGSLLRDPLDQASRFRFDDGFDALVEADGKVRFAADNMVLTDERIARRDFAYIAGMPGPADNRIVILAGLGDAGVKRAAAIAADPEQLASLRSGGSRVANGFEALFRVRTVQKVDVGAKVVVERGLRAAAIWDSSAEPPVYRPIEVSPAATPTP